MIIRVSILVVAACAAVSVSLKKRNPSSIKQSADEEKEVLTDELLAEDNPRQETRRAKTEKQNDVKIHSCCEMDCGLNMNSENSVELCQLSNIGKEYEQRKLTLDRKILLLYGLSEQKSYMEQLRCNLHDKISEIRRLNVTADSLRAEIIELQRKMKQGCAAENQLQMAKKVLEKMQRKQNASEDYVNRQLIMLQKQVSGFREDGFLRNCSGKVLQKINGVKDVDIEVLEIRRQNKELEFEKRDLSGLLLAAQAKIAALSSLTESNIVRTIGEGVHTLKRANNDLLKQIDILQENRFDIVEELVYQRWLNACMQFEVRHYRAPSKKPSDQNPGKANSCSISSCTSSSETDNNENSSTDTSSSSSQRNRDRKLGSILNIKKWKRSKSDTSSANSSPLLNKKMENCITESPDTTSSARVRRVSFNESVTTVTLPSATSQESPETSPPHYQNKPYWLQSSEAVSVTTEVNGSCSSIDAREQAPNVIACDQSNKVAVEYNVIGQLLSIFLVVFTMLFCCFQPIINLG